MKKIQRAAVVGSGVMGAAIAAHFANAGIPCLLLDIVPSALTPQEQESGLTLEHPKVRNRLLDQAMVRLKSSKPPAFYTESCAERITLGNLEDHLHLLQEVDWIVEAVVEKLEVKQSVLALIESARKPDAIVSTNTSGISINAMSAKCGDEFRKHFLGTHFFNPPRYMKLMEIIPCESTDPAIIETIIHFCEHRLGKGVVIAKDTPNFIANRIGTYGLLTTLDEMQAQNYSVEEADAVTGPATGRPSSATLRTIDLVGHDVLAHVVNNVYDNIADEKEKAVFRIPSVMSELLNRGWIGEKQGQGFYKKITGASGSEIQALNLQSLEYAPAQKIASSSLDAAKKAQGAPAKWRTLLSVPDRYSAFAWDTIKHVLIYSAEKLGEIADSIEDIDQALKWGFNWELGPFETWDAIGLKESVARMEQEGLTVPAWVKEWIAAGNDSFYQRREGQVFYYHNKEMKSQTARPEQISLDALKESGRVIIANKDASLIDIGDDVACLEFHSKNNAIGPDILAMIERSADEVSRNYRGLVIANEGKNFCVGANIIDMLKSAKARNWKEIEDSIERFQTTLMLIKNLDKPKVAAPHRMTLGGGVELCMTVDQVMLSAETYYGLVEAGIGVIPGGGGCKEMALRASQLVGAAGDLQPLINKAFETIAMAKVSSSGHDAYQLGLTRQSDTVVMNHDFRIYQAKQTVLHMEQVNYMPPASGKIRVVGETGKAVMQLAAYTMRQGGFISKHDELIAGKLAHVLSGGNVPAGSYVTEQYMLDLEREAFVSLLGEEKTQQRIEHLLATGKHLRN